MQTKEHKNLILVRLFPNENINEKLKEACKNYNVKTAIVISGIGQLKKVKLGYFKEKGNYSPDIFNKPLELLALSGNICNQGNEYVLHLHAVLSDENKNAIGGHLIEGEISITGEIVLLKTDLKVHRKLNEKTGLQDLNLE